MQILKDIVQLRRDRDDYTLASLQGDTAKMRSIEYKYDLDLYSPDIVIKTLIRMVDVWSDGGILR